MVLMIQKPRNQYFIIMKNGNGIAINDLIIGNGYYNTIGTGNDPA